MQWNCIFFWFQNHVPHVSADIHIVDFGNCQKMHCVEEKVTVLWNWLNSALFFFIVASMYMISFLITYFKFIFIDYVFSPHLLMLDAQLIKKKICDLYRLSTSQITLEEKCWCNGTLVSWNTVLIIFSCQFLLFDFCCSKLAYYYS
jgi:hypothetical protein